jgi:hypothetical protein
MEALANALARKFTTSEERWRAPMAAFFPFLIFNARPAAGKSEILHALGQVPLPERIDRFHVGPMHVVDDFPMLWAWFEEDALLEGVFRRPRLHTSPDGYFLHHDLWHVLIRRMCLEVEKFERDQPRPHTVVLEFSRGAEHGGYRAAYQHLSQRVLQQAASVYVRVTYAESQRKNRLRFNPDRQDSILEHALSDEKLERLYGEDDWAEFTAKDAEVVEVRGLRVPYVVFENEDDVTTRGGEPLYRRLELALARLWRCRFP